MSIFKVGDKVIVINEDVVGTITRISGYSKDEFPFEVKLDNYNYGDGNVFCNSSELINISNTFDVHAETTDPDVKLPQYANKGDAGMDVYANEDVVIGLGETKIIKTGLKVAIPEGFEIQVRPRSGISLNTPLRVANAPGTIDENFRDEIGIIITNTSTEGVYHKHIMDGIEYVLPFHLLTDKGNKQGNYEIKKGDRIAQLVLQRVPRINWVQVTSVKDIGEDRGGGFGSSGVK